MRFFLFFWGCFLLPLFPLKAADDDIDVLVSRAKNGDVEAAVALGKHYFDMEKNVKQAEFWAKAAADAGNAEAQYYLARIYDAGTQGKHPNTEIVSVLEKSAEQGFAPAQVMLAGIYRFGRRGIPQDMKKARMWYEMAAAKGSGEAMTQLNAIYQQSVDMKVGDMFTGENIEWLELSVKQGNVEAALRLAEMAEKGRYMPKDLKRAAELYQKAADAGLFQAQAAVGKMYANGEGFSQNTEKAVFWLTKAAEQGYVEAQRKLASVYTYQHPDQVQAYAWQVVSLSALFPDTPDLVQVSPDLERLLRSMTPDQIKDGQKLAYKIVEIIKENKRKQEKLQKKQIESMKRYTEKQS